jgi:hypothetical protein
MGFRRYASKKRAVVTLDLPHSPGSRRVNEIQKRISGLRFADRNPLQIASEKATSSIGLSDLDCVSTGVDSLGVRREVLRLQYNCPSPAASR